MSRASSSCFKRYIITLSANNCNFVSSFPAIPLISASCLLVADVIHRTVGDTESWTHQRCPPDADWNGSAVSTWRKTGSAWDASCGVAFCVCCLSCCRAGFSWGGRGSGHLGSRHLGRGHTASAARKQKESYSDAAFTFSQVAGRVVWWCSVHFPPFICPRILTLTKLVPHTRT